MYVRMFVRMLILALCISTLVPTKKKTVVMHSYIDHYSPNNPTTFTCLPLHTQQVIISFSTLAIMTEPPKAKKPKMECDVDKQWISETQGIGSSSKGKYFLHALFRRPDSSDHVT